MIVQFIKYDQERRCCEGVIARIKITKRNKDLLIAIKDGLFIELRGGVYQALHTYLTIAVKGTGLTVDVLNVYVSNRTEEFKNFYPTPYYPNNEFVKECKDYLERKI